LTRTTSSTPSERPPSDVADERAQVDLDRLPLAAVLLRQGKVFAANQGFLSLVDRSLDELKGLTVREAMQRIVHPADFSLLERTVDRYPTPASPMSGQVWCRVVGPAGDEHPVRVDWRGGEDPSEISLFFVEATTEASGQKLTESLARAAGGLTRATSEEEVLIKSADALGARGFSVTWLLFVEGDPLMAYGPTRSGSGDQPGPRPWEAVRPSRAFVEKINPGFHERRVAFFPDIHSLVREVYPDPLGAELERRVSPLRVVQAPVFVGERAFGAMVVSGESLTPIMAGAVELYAELVGGALENVRLRRERLERERLAALGEASAVMAHEVRNPVGAILNAVALIRRAAVNDPLQEEMLRVVSEEAGRLENVVNQLLEVGRPLLPRPQRVALTPLVEGCLKILVDRQEAEPGRVERVAGPEVYAQLDPDLAQLALMNVLRNAVQSTPASKPIQVRLEEGGGFGAVVVEDSGPGLPSHIMNRLGEPFTTTRAAGTGIGLAVVRRVLEASLGRLEVSTSGLGGARVALRFPQGAAEERGG
jgi:signal transduction histidine kinase